MIVINAKCVVGDMGRTVGDVCPICEMEGLLEHRSESMELLVTHVARRHVGRAYWDISPKSPNHYAV